MWEFVFSGLCGVVGLEGLADRAEVAEAGLGVGHGDLTRAIAAGDDPGAMGGEFPAGGLRQAAEMDRGQAADQYVGVSDIPPQAGLGPSVFGIPASTGCDSSRPHEARWLLRACTAQSS